MSRSRSRRLLVVTAVVLIVCGCSSPSGPAAFDRWEPLAPLPIAVRSAAVATGGQRVYVLGGSTASGRTGAVQILDVAAGTWTYGESLPEPTDWATAAWVAGALHLIGGVTNQSGASTQHLVYDRLGNSWSPAPAVPSAIAGTAGLSDGSRIYVFAGNSGSSPAHTSTTRIYDVASQGWTTALAVPSPRINWSGTYHRERFYLIGGGTPGIGTSDELLSYDPQANDWTVLRRIPLPREAHGVATALERVCAIGGRLAASGNFNTPYADVSCYDPATDTWAPAPALPRPLQEVAAVSVNGTIVAVGGADGSNLPVADVSALRVR